jgi:hypothetical protein
VPVAGAVAVAVVLALSGCTGAEEDAAPTVERASAAPSQEDETQDQDSGQGSGSGAGVEDADLEDVLVEQTVAQPADPDDLTTVGVRSLRVEGDVMVLELAVTPDFASVSDSSTLSLYDIWRGVAGTFQPTLLDRVNLKRYQVVQAGAGRSFASDAVYTRTVNGQPVRAYAVFAAPEDDIEVIDVVLADAWPAFTDVPVER